MMKACIRSLFIYHILHVMLFFVSEEKQLKCRIKELMKYRRNGITLLEGGYKHHEQFYSIHE